MIEQIDADDYNAFVASQKPRGKYGARRVTVDGIAFDSQAEANRYGELKHLWNAREISNLECHPSYEITVNGRKVGTYSPDFRYVNASGETIVEDVKSPATRRKELYRLKKKLVEAEYGITVVEVVYP